MQQNRSIRLFKHGPAAEVRLFFLVLLCLGLMITDAGWRVLDPVRQTTAIMLYPFQKAALWPRDVVVKFNDWSNAVAIAKQESEAIQRQRIELAQISAHAGQMAAENAQLRRLLGVKNTVQTPSVAVEILYTAANPQNQSMVLTKGSNHGIEPGMPVIGEGGIVGQIRRVTAMTSEAALVTNENVSIPAMVLRNGLRVIIFGSGQGGKLEVRYLSMDADIRVGDSLTTSGIGGIYPPGISIGTVTSIETNSAEGFVRAIAAPSAHPERYRHFLVLLVPTDEVPETEELDAVTHLLKKPQ
ncbi:MAG: rod shape-determining protein MreC [Alcaligenaceae bacterium]|nr:rod shape-determining protein MreC [Alcaligenaceae bacterium]